MKQMIADFYFFDLRKSVKICVICVLIPPKKKERNPAYGFIVFAFQMLILFAAGFEIRQDENPAGRSSLTPLRCFRGLFLWS